MYRTAIFDFGLSDDALISAVDDALAAAAEKGAAPMRYRFTEDPNAEETVHHWHGADLGDQLRIVEDRPMGAAYALAISAEEPKIDAMIEALTAAFGRRDCASVREGLRERLAENPATLMQLTVCDTLRFQPESEALLLDLSRSSDRDLRMAAAQAMGILSWPSLRARLAEMEPAEADPTIRGVIRYALENPAEDPDRN
ncbi:MAG TPA: hypothetical protein VE053_08180 [Allosphingosinicella sp.]|nr:hypothetical protein [Allosphingosinicella sp.]